MIGLTVKNIKNQDGYIATAVLYTLFKTSLITDVTVYITLQAMQYE
jgi:hypothetical protein